MVIVEVDEKLKSKLKNVNLSSGILDNCLNSKFVAIQEHDSKIVGACFVGGLLNNQGIEILEEFRGKGLSKKLLDEMVGECKRRKISFITGAFKPTNIPSIRTHVKIGYRAVFTFHYNKTEGKEIVVMLPFNKKGEFLFKLAKGFDTRLGNMFFAIFLKVTRPILKNLLAFSGEIVPRVDFLYSVRSFEKVQKTLDEIGLEIKK